jgi:hypothetical protein
MSVVEQFKTVVTSASDPTEWRGGLERSRAGLIDPDERRRAKWYKMGARDLSVKSRLHKRNAERILGR